MTLQEFVEHLDKKLFTIMKFEDSMRHNEVITKIVITLNDNTSPVVLEVKKI